MTNLKDKCTKNKGSKTYVIYMVKFKVKLPIVIIGKLTTPILCVIASWIITDLYEDSINSFKLLSMCSFNNCISCLCTHTILKIYTETSCKKAL